MIRGFLRTIAKGLTEAGAAAQSLFGDRTLARPLKRDRFVAGINRDSCLEIGPFDNPVLRGERVRYFDILDREALVIRAGQHARSFSGVPEIHYVSPTGDLRIVDRRFDCILSSHVIEHQPDLVRHLQDVGNLLADGGAYYAIVPDKRYCFDRFNALTEIGDVLDAHIDRRRVHTPSAVRDHLENVTHNNALRHWLGHHGMPAIEKNSGIRAAAQLACGRAARGEYVDVHAWMFTPGSFVEIVTELNRRGLTPLVPEFVSDTRFGSQEFYARLTKAAA
ncbi:methyltransferase domain-containing protein [Novosphingobium sp. ZN18A2]|uniref:class I SAM-dependent methyltransferase n=1 Tax=Novosphingobium sp. ZN18A2 TaxID=3079861 RepID=UPI0030CCF12F